MDARPHTDLKEQTVFSKDLVDKCYKAQSKNSKKNKNAKNCDEKSYEWPPLGDYEMLAG